MFADIFKILPIDVSPNSEKQQEQCIFDIYGYTKMEIAWHEIQRLIPAYPDPRKHALENQIYLFRS